MSRVRSRVSSGSFLTCKLTWQKCTLIVNIEFYFKFYFNHIKRQMKYQLILELKWLLRKWSNLIGYLMWVFLTLLVTYFSNYFLGYWLYRAGAFFSKFNNSASSNDWNNWIYRRCSWKYRLFNATKWFLSVCYSYFYHSSYLIDPIFYGTYLLLISYESFYSIHFIILLY